MKELLNSILEEMETFLTKWTEYMEQAGYLEHTTAKKEDCILSLLGLVEPIQICLAEKSPLFFSSILKNNREVADFLVETGRGHQARGLKAEMFFGCFKTLLHALDDIIFELNLPDSIKLRQYMEFRRVVDAIETIAIAAWDDPGHDEKMNLLAEQNRSLTLRKEQVQKYLSVNLRYCPGNQWRRGNP